MQDAYVRFDSSLPNNILTKTIKNMSLDSNSNTGKGKLVIYMAKGIKTTETVYCSKSQSTEKMMDINAINGSDSELQRVYYNGIQIFPDRTLTVQELCKYLPEHPQPGTIRTWVNKNKIPFHKAGSAVNAPLYFKQNEIDEWTKNGRVCNGSDLYKLC